MAEVWMTTGNVADEIGYSIPWVRKQIDLGRLTATEFKDGERRRSLRVRRADLDRFIEIWLPPASR